jgi:hypothetical protein
MRLGQADRQFDQHEGRRGAVPGACPLCMAYGAAVVVMAFDEVGQADTRRARWRSASAPTSCLTGIGFPPEDIIFDPNIFAVATGIEEHNNYGVDFIEARAKSRRRCPHVHISGGLSNLSFSFRGNEPVRRAMHSACSSITPSQPGWTWRSSMRASSTSMTRSTRSCATACEDVILNRARATRPSGSSRSPRSSRATDAAAEKAGRGMARLAGREAARARAGQGHRRACRRGYRGSAPRHRRARRAPDRSDRRPADGRHERRRRPVRLRQDVPAAGGEIRPRDEKGGRPPLPLYRGGKGRKRRRPRAGSSWRRSRATCTISARTSSASCSSATASK